MKHRRRDGTQPNLHPVCARRQVDDRDIAAGECVLLWIDQNCPMEKLFWSALFEENSVGNYKKPRMNKHKINNHNNTFYNQKEQQSAKKMKHHRRDGTQPNLHTAQYCQ